MPRKKKPAPVPAPAGLLDGLRVVELGRPIASPLVGMLLAEQGAEVVRVVSPSDPPVDPVLDAILARGKVDAALDATRPEGLAERRRLLAQADVVIDGWDADGAAHPGLDFERIRLEDNPGLVSCRVTPFPDDDPRAALPGHETIAGTAGFLFNRPLGTPYYHDFPMASVTAALYAVNGIVAALVARLRLGRGQHVDTSLYHASLTAQVIQILIKAGVPRAFLALKMVGSPFMRVWQCKDGRWVYLHITIPAHNVRMLELLEDNGFGDEVRRIRGLMSEQTISDPSQVGSIAEAKKLKAVYEEVFLSRPADDWEGILGQELCCIKVRKVEEWLRDSLDAGMTDACTVEDPVFGELLGPGALVSCDDHPATIVPRRVEPEAVEGLLGRWEKAPRPKPDEVDTPADAELGHPLEGVRVLDLSRVIAGPCACRVLAELGAEVLSVQSPTNLDWALSFHLVFNAGKKSVTLDFTTDDGKDKLWKVLDDYRPDAFLQNYRHLDLARTIGVGPEALTERFPGIAYTHLNAYGNHGIWKDRPGFEQVVQAVSGIQISYARGGRPKLLPSPIIDIGCGLLGAFGTLLGIYHQKRTGEGASLSTHLTSVSVLLQLHRVAEFQRRRCLEKARLDGADASFDADREVIGDVVICQGVHAGLAGPRGDIRTWLLRTGLVDDGQQVEGRELAVAARAMRWRSVEHWQSSIIEAGVQRTVGLLRHPNIKHVIEDVARLDPREHPIVRRRDFPGSPQQLTFVANPLRLSLTPLVEVDASPMRGTHTKELLDRVGPAVPAGTGVIPYPKGKHVVVWAANLVRWGYFAWKSGNI